MILHRLRRAPLQRRLFLLVALPALVVALATAIRWPASSTDPAATADRQRAELQQALDVFLQELGAVADEALRTGPASALGSAPALALAARLEGVGLLSKGGGFKSWAGSPSEPPDGFASQGWPRWVVRLDGVRTRVLARGGPDSAGRVSLATGIIDSTLDDLRFTGLLGKKLTREVQFEIEFLDSRAYYPSLLLDPEEHRDPAPPLLRSAVDSASQVALHGGQLMLAVAALAPVDLGHRRSGVLADARCWGVAVFVLMLAGLFEWKPLTRRLSRAAWILGLIGLCRFLLLWSQTPGRGLPRDLGAASLYGTSSFWNLLASPADLFLSGLAFLLGCVTCRNYARALGQRHPVAARSLSGLLASIATLAAWVLTLSVVRDSRIPFLERPAPLAWDYPLVVWLGLALVLIGAAELWGALASLYRRDERRTRDATDRLGVLVALVLLSMLCAVMLQWNSQRLNLERLGSEFAPDVLDQSEHRKLVLSAAIREVHDRYHREATYRQPLSSQPGFLAYRHWANSGLFRSGYHSALDLYNSSGEVVSQFSFDLPPLDEVPDLSPDDPEQIVAREEGYDTPTTVKQNLIHVEMPVHRGDEIIGYVIGHVQDAPENLPFLPWSRPYLAALGQGALVPGGSSQAVGPEYVLYERDTAVKITTLRQPPALSPDWPQEGSLDTPVRTVAGEQPYVGLSLTDDLGRRHLLLIPALTLLDRLAAVVRLSLLALIVYVSLALLPWLFRHQSLRQLLLLFRRSFYRKLLVAVLLASAIPLVGLALFLQGYVERRGDAELISSATQFVNAAKRIVDYGATTLEIAEVGDTEEAAQAVENGFQMNDPILYWLRRFVGQEIHVYADGTLQASSKRELFSSGLLPLRLDGEVQERLVVGGLPSLVTRSSLGPSRIPVAYAPVRLTGSRPTDLIVAVPLVLEQRQIAQSVSRVNEMILIATVALVGMLAVAAALLARTVARPVRDLVAATDKIGAGDYAARLKPRTEDELADLAQRFNAMASALSRQRSDLERRKDYIEALLRHATTAVISVDVDQRVVTFNPAALNLLEPVADRLTGGVPLVDCLASSEELEPLSRALATTPRSGEPVEVDLSREGKLRRYRLVAVDLRNTAGESFGRLILFDDVTELMQSNQLAAWAEMARVIAHEIKNPLTPIQLSSEHLQRLLRDRGLFPAPDIEACLDTIIKQVRALYDIAGEFSTYAKLPVLSPQPTDPVAFMRAVLQPYRTSNPEGVEFVERYVAAPQVAIDQRVLSRAVINLIENALQAMSGKGTLTVTVQPSEAGKEVVLAVSDDGPGLDSQAQRRLFEPYFSTKSSGTGLGLAIAQRAVEAHHGRIEVESAPGRGAAFLIRLPVQIPR